MSVLSIPNTFITGTTIQAAPFNSNFQAVATAVNSIDNSNIGAAGLFASQLIPTSAAQATFGGLIGYTFLAPSASTVPLTISGVTSQSSDILDVTLTAGGAKAFAVGSAGAVAIGPAFNASSSPGDLTISRSANTAATFWGSSGTTAGVMDFGLNTSGQFTFKNTGTSFVALNASAFTVNSDISAKQNVAKSPYGLATLMTLKPSSYVLKSSGLADLGFVAQDVQPIIPEAVRTDNDGILGISIMPMLSVQTAAIQELAAMFEAYVAAHP